MNNDKPISSSARAAREASAWCQATLLRNLDLFELHELPYAVFADRLDAARRRLIAIAPAAAASIDAAFDKLDEELAELPTNLMRASAE